MDLSAVLFQKTSFLSDSELLQKIDSDHLFRDRIGRYFQSEKKKRKRESLDSLFLDDTIPI